jgi:hypothetical protein
MCYVNAVELPFQPDVHQHEVGPVLQHQRRDVFTPGGDADYNMADPGQLLLNIPGNDPVVLDDQYF